MWLYLALILLLTSCSGSETPKPPKKEDPVEYPDPTDPETAVTVGFFMNDWREKSFNKPGYVEVEKPLNPVSVTVEVDASRVLTKIQPTMFGQNSVSYIQELANEEPILTYLKDLNIEVIRFPGGSISDTYFWNESFNTKPFDAPDYLFDGNQEALWTWNYWYGKNNPTHDRANLEDYYSLLQKTGSEGMISVNYAYARYGLSEDPVAKAAQLAADWVRYDNGRTKYWEIGNENHGAWEKGYRINTANNKDGQPEYISGELYAKHAQVFIDSMRHAAAEIGHDIFIGVGIVEEYNNWLWESSKAVPQWNSGVMTEMDAADGADFYIIHSYYVGNDQNSFNEIISSAKNKTGGMSKYVNDEMKKYGTAPKPIALTEYNISATGEAGSMQQASYANGMHTTIVLAEAIKNHIGNAVRWDLVNGWQNGADHGMFNKGDEPDGVAKWNPRPVFYYMYYMQRMLGDRMLAASSSASSVLAYGSSYSSGEKGVILVNTAAKQEVVKVVLKNTHSGDRAYWFTLTGGSDNGDFSRKVLVNGHGPKGASGGPVEMYKTMKANSTVVDGDVTLSLPPRAVVFLVVENE